MGKRRGFGKMSLGGSAIDKWELMFLGFAICGRPVERKNNDLFASPSADIVVQAAGFYASDSLHQRIQLGPRYLDKLRPNLFQQVAPFFNRQRGHQMLLGGSQNTLQPNHQQIANQMRTDVLGPPAHVFLLEMGNPLADGSFDLSLCLQLFDPQPL